MHIPDGFIDGKTAATTAVLAAMGVGMALRRVKRELPPRKTPLLGLAAAFLFAAQMLNFPVAGGTSGHLIGGVLAAALLGPSAAVVVVTTVLIVQCFLFQDGGVLALGANVFNMAIIGGGGGGVLYLILFRCLCKSGGNALPRAEADRQASPADMRGRVTAVAFASWVSTVAASIACAGELAWSGMFSWTAGFTAMAGVHCLIGLGEGLISALVFLAIQRARPEVIADASRWNASGTPGKAARYGEFAGFGLLVAAGLAIFVAPFACPWPDGLEFVAAKLGFEQHATHPILPALAPDYHIPGIHSAAGATALAGAIGLAAVFGLALLLGKLLVPKRTKADS